MDSADDAEEPGEAPPSSLAAGPGSLDLLQDIVGGAFRSASAPGGVAAGAVRFAPGVQPAPRAASGALGGAAAVTARQRDAAASSPDAKVRRGLSKPPTGMDRAQFLALPDAERRRLREAAAAAPKQKKRPSHGDGRTAAAKVQRAGATQRGALVAYLEPSALTGTADMQVDEAPPPHDTAAGAAAVIKRTSFALCGTVLGMCFDSPSGQPVWIKGTVTAYDADADEGQQFIVTFVDGDERRFGRTKVLSRPVRK